MKQIGLANLNIEVKQKPTAAADLNLFVKMNANV